MLRLATAQTPPLRMAPAGHAAVSASAVLPKRYFVPKPLAPPGPPNRAHLAHVHRASRRGRLTERSPTCSLRPRADRRCRWCRREVAGATPRAHLRTRGLVSAGRWSAVGAVERTRQRPPAQAAAGARQRGGAVPPPRRPRMASPRGGGHRPPPAHPPFPPDLDLRHRRCHEEDLLLCGEGASWRRRSVRRDAPTIGGRRGHLGRRPSRAHTRQPRREPCAPRPSRSRRGSAADRRSRGERAAAPGDGGLFLQTGAATAGGLPWATAAAVRERGAAAAAAPGVTVHYKRAQEPGSA